MASDARVQQAREHHRALALLDAERDQHRQVRNQLIRQLRADDPERWTYQALANAIGPDNLSAELVAAIVKGRT